MGFDTRAFGTVYKRMRTGSFASASYGSLPVTLYAGYILTASWDNLSDLTSSPQMSGSFLNFFPLNASTTESITTRHSSSNAGYVAIPWGSMACDYLWNVQTPKWTPSISSSSWTYFDDNYSLTRTGGNFTSSVWELSLSNTSSFFRDNIPGYSAFGVASYNVTSSWYVWDAKFLNSSSFRYAIKVVSTSSAFSGMPVGTYLITSSYIHGTGGRPVGNTPGVGTDYSDNIGYRITWPDSGSTYAKSAIDNQYFDRGGGAAISRALISQSLLTQSLYGTATINPNLGAFRTALKQRRLFYPTPVSNPRALNGSDIWHRTFTGFFADEMFDENGGIYNIQFILKRHISSNHYPDTGTYMNVFIHDVQTVAPTPVNRVAGAAGWYPPANNIATIGHGYNGSPIMSFYDAQSGYLYESFNLNLVQYGKPAQLCFEPSGSLTDDKFFGIIIDEVSICKIGVTTDPRFIKPTTVAGSQVPVDSGQVFNPGLPSS